MVIFEEGLESSPSFWTTALQAKYQERAEPAFLTETTDRKIKEKKENRKEMMALLAG